MKTLVLPPCGTCEAGELKKRKAYRMSGPVVVIGYILLIPSIIGMIFGFLLMVAGGGGGSAAIQAQSEATKTALIEKGIPATIADKVANHEPLGEATLATLSSEDRAIVNDARVEQLGTQAGTGLAAAATVGIAIFLIIASFVGGLLGWLLIMKKRILQCDHCGTVVAAS